MGAGFFVATEASSGRAPGGRLTGQLDFLRVTLIFVPVLLTEKKTEAILCGHPGSFATYRKG